MKKVIAMVREFHEAFGHPVGKDGHPTGNRLLQRLTYKQEEHLEFLKALLADDPVELFDAVGDLAYFAAGDLVEFGLDDAAPVKFEAEKEFGFEFLSDNLLKFYTSTHAALGECAVAAANGNSRAAIFYSSYLLRYSALLCKELDVDFDAIMTEIHESNMTKLWPEDPDVCGALLERAGFSEEDVVFVSAPRAGFMVCYNAVTQKVIKNPDFRKPDLRKLVVGVH